MAREELHVHQNVIQMQGFRQARTDSSTSTASNILGSGGPSNYE